MARTSSQSLPYWQFDVGLFDDIKIVDLNEKYGPMGVNVYLIVLSVIAKTNGYFALFNEQLILSIYRSVGSKWIKNRAVIAEVIQACGVCGLFDVNLLTKGVITSRGIQRRWLYAKEKSRAKGYSTAQYWLLDNDEPVQDFYLPNENKCSINGNKCSNNNDKCNMNCTHKVKVSKGNISVCTDGISVALILPGITVDKPPTHTLEEYKLVAKKREKSRVIRSFKKISLIDKHMQEILKDAFADFEKPNFDQDNRVGFNKNVVTKKYTAEELTELYDDLKIE